MKRLKAKDLIFVTLQVLLFILYFLAPFDHQWRLPFWLSCAALVVCVSGLLVALLAVFQLRRNLSPFPTPVGQGELITTGLYKSIRHPIYTGLILFFTGYAVYDGSFAKVLCALLLFLLFYFKSQYEEQLLIEKFPQYPEYKKRTGRFFPFL